MDFSLEHLIDTAVRPFTAFLYADTSLYWPYLVSAGILAIGVPAILGRGATGGMAAAVGQAFSRRIWWAPSTKADYRYYVINGFLFPLIFAPAILTSGEFGLWIEDTLAAMLGARETPLFDAVTIRVLYTVAFFLAFDFGRFLAHLLQHRVAFFWQFHKVHHSAEALTPITAFRTHPVDLLVMALGGNLLGGLVTGLFLYLGAGAVSIYLFLGLHVAHGVYNLIGNLRHSHVWLSYGPLDYIFISPAQHQIHHSTLERHRDRNCGFAFAIWDWMFGTLYVPKEKEEFPMGLGDGSDGTWHSVGRLYWWPVVMASRVLRGAEAQPPPSSATR